MQEHINATQYCSHTGMLVRRVQGNKREKVRARSDIVAFLKRSVDMLLKIA
jgi:hypothetical protein